MVSVGATVGVSVVATVGVYVGSGVGVSVGGGVGVSVGIGVGVGPISTIGVVFSIYCGWTIGGFDSRLPPVGGVVLQATAKIAGIRTGYLLASFLDQAEIGQSCQAFLQR